MAADRRRAAAPEDREDVIDRTEPPDPIATPAEVAEVAAAVRRAGRLYFDLEFVSDGRYVPELALIQVAWGDPEHPQVVAVDPLAVDPAPLVALVADPAVETVLHAGQGDLSLLATRAGVEGRAIVDTQLAAALLGLGDQLGYAALVELLLGVVLDKSHQFTAWTRRPLDPEQLRYALDDVRYLPAVWAELAARLEARGPARLARGGVGGPRPRRGAAAGTGGGVPAPARLGPPQAPLAGGPARRRRLARAGSAGNATRRPAG